MSIVIPALNAAGTIGSQLAALAAQEVDGSWEVLVVDNGSVDGTVAVTRSFEQVIPDLRVVHCEQPGTGAARNAGAAAARGDLLLFCDADDVVGTGWIAAMVAALGRSDAVGGGIDNDLLNPDRPAHLPRHPDRLPVAAGFLPRTLTANLGVRREVFEAIGGFAEQYDYGSDDTEFSWRLQLAGYTLAYEPAAVLHYRHRDTLKGVAIKAYRTGRSRGRLFREYHAKGMPRPRLLGAVRRWVQLVVALPAVPFSPRVRWWWADQAGAAWGRIVGSIAFRVVYL